MIRRSTWLVLGVFLALLGVYLLVSRRPVANAPAATATPAPRLLDLAPEAVMRLSVTRTEDQRQVVLTHQGADWQLEAPQSAPADAAQVQTALETLSSTAVLNRLGEDALAPLGLDPPQAVVDIRTRGRLFRLEVGATTPIGSGYYVRLDGALLVVERYALDVLLSWPDAPPLAVSTTTPTPVPR